VGEATEIAAYVLRSAPPRAVVNIILNGASDEPPRVDALETQRPEPTQFERHSKSVGRFLQNLPPAGGGEGPPIFLEPRQLSDSQLAHVASRASLPEDDVRVLRAASALSFAHSTISQEVFYGLVAKGLPQSAEELLSHRSPVLRKALEQSIADRTIPSAAVPDLEATMFALESAAIDMLRAWAAGTDDSKLSLATIVDGSPEVPEDHRNQFLRAFLRHTSTAEAFWHTLEQVEFPATSLKRLRFSMEAARATGHFRPVIDELHARVAGTGAQPLSDEKDSLASLTEAEWASLLADLPTGKQFPVDTPGADPAEQRQNYAKTLVRNVESRFRTSAISYRV
jgi:hypothetical protein